MSSTSSKTSLCLFIEDAGDQRISQKSTVRLGDSIEESAEDEEVRAAQRPNLVSWSIHWQQPALILGFTLCGLAGAIGHHLYYRFLDKKLVSSTESQQWALRVGTAFSVFTITMLRAAVVAAYNQYIWKVFRDHAYSVADLDKIFSLTSDFTGFFSLALFKCGRLVILLALLCWLLPLTSLTPTATLSVVSSLHTETTNQSVPSLNFSSASWQYTTPQEDIYMSQQESMISEDMVMPQLIAPAANSSYTVQFYGPTIQCEDASVSEQAAFDQYSVALLNESGIFTSLTFQMFNDGDLGFLNVSDLTSLTSDASTLYSFLLASVFIPNVSDVHVQDSTYDTWYLYFGVQTANSSILCSSANASFELDIDSANGVQSISQSKTNIINLANYSIFSPLETPGQDDPYRSIFYNVAFLLFGNYSVGPWGWTSGQFLDTGLITCDEIFWWLNTDNYNDTIFRQNLDLAILPANFTLPAEYSLCRNRSLSLAIQDLANNITISFWSNPNMTVNVSIPVTITSSQNVYHYDSRNLIISYATGIVATFFAVIVGLMAIHSNGVCHSISFSAIMTSTSGNPHIGELSKGQSLGAKPLSRSVAKRKLRLGVSQVAENEAEKDEWGDPINRIGFGLDGTVMKLIKGVKSV